MKSVGIQLRIGDLLFAVQKRWKIIASLTFLGLVFGLLMSAMSFLETTTDIFQINGSVMISAVDTNGSYGGNARTPSRTDLAAALDLYDTVDYIIFSDRLLDEVIAETELLGISSGDLRNSLSVSRYGETSILTIRLIWENGEEGILLWNTIVEKTNSLMTELVNLGTLRIINEPKSAVYGSRGTSVKTWMALPVLGFAAGLGFSIVELLMRPTLINPKDIETMFGLEIIGMIPLDNAYFHKRSSILVKDDSVSSEVSQNYSAAAYILINRIGVRDQCQCIYVTSAGGQEGRTTAAANLAIQMSDMEHRTLLIDFDYKNPTLGTLFLNSLDYNRSINALYRGEITPTDAITNLTGYLDLLPMVMEYSLITVDSAVIDMINRLKQQYEYIIIDAPPVGKESETLSLNKVANSVVFVAGYDMSSIPEIQSSLEKLDKSGMRIIGCIVNRIQSTKNLLSGDANQNIQKVERAADKFKKRKDKRRPKKDGDGDEKDVVESIDELIAHGKEETAKAEAQRTIRRKLFERKPREKKVKEKKSKDMAPVAEEAAETAVEPAAETARKKKKSLRSEKRKPLLRSRKKEAKEKPLSAESFFEAAETQSAVPKRQKNALFDLMDEDDSEIDAQSDDEVVQELLKIGLEGSWASASKKTEKSDNLFEQL